MALIHRLKPTSRICEIKGKRGHYLLARQGPANSRVISVDLATRSTNGGSFLVKNTDITSVQSYSELALAGDTLQDDPIPEANGNSPRSESKTAAQTKPQSPSPPEPPAVPQTIRIDPEVWLGLQKLAVPFVETPNEVLRRLLGLGERQK